MSVATRAKQYLYRCAYRAAVIYWRVFRPKTYGAKAIITRRNGDDLEALLVSTSYGQSSMWTLPGGGYRPRKETAQHAINRELQEELGIHSMPIATMGEYRTEAEGKRDTVTIFHVHIENAASFISRVSAEVAQTSWVRIHDIASGAVPTARIVRRAAEMIVNKRP